MARGVLGAWRAATVVVPDGDGHVRALGGRGALGACVLGTGVLFITAGAARSTTAMPKTLGAQACSPPKGPNSLSGGRLHGGCYLPNPQYHREQMHDRRNQWDEAQDRSEIEHQGERGEHR